MHILGLLCIQIISQLVSYFEVRLIPLRRELYILFSPQISCFKVVEVVAHQDWLL
jgi:hypothetical protein